MFSRDEKEEIRQLVYDEMAEIEREIQTNAGSYHYMCRLLGVAMFTHEPHGTVLRHF